MKKKKIILPIVLAVFVGFLVFINTEDANAGTGMCSYQAIFYFNEGINADKTGIGTTVNNTSWEDGTGSYAEATNVSYEIRNMTVSDCVNYTTNMNYKSSSSYASAGDKGCSLASDGSMTCGNVHINSGSYETGKNATGEGVSNFMEYFGGGDIQKGCEAWIDGTIKADNITIKDNGINSESGKYQDEIVRDYDFDSGTAFTGPDGKTFKYSAQTVIKTWTAPCEEEEKEVEKSEDCSCSRGVGGGGNSMTTCGGTIVNSLSGSDCGSFAGTLSSPDNAVCQSSPTVNWSVSVSITETITVSVNMNPSTIYAGGGVGIAVNHNASSSSSINGICVSSNEKAPSCPSGYSYSSSRKECVGREWDSTGCYNYKTGEYYGCYVETTTGFTCKKVGGVNAVDQAKAESLARSAAAALGSGGKSPDAITLKAKQSNDEKDNVVYNLSSDVPYQGIALSSGGFNSGKVGNMFNDNVMGTSSSYSSMINQACINIYTGKVRYISSGSCDSENEVDGGHKYYIPLKYMDSKFNFNVYSGNISTLTTSTLNANCYVDVYQNFYDKDGGYKFIYRPVDITEPVTTVFPSRNEGKNWTTLYNTNNGSSGSYDLAMKRDKTEYSVSLDPALIQTIKNINDKYNNNYASLTTLNSSGKSNVLNEIGISIESGRNYNELGKCNRKYTYTSADGTIIDNSSSILEGTECW